MKKYGLIVLVCVLLLSQVTAHAANSFGTLEDFMGKYNLLSALLSDGDTTKTPEITVDEEDGTRSAKIVPDSAVSINLSLEDASDDVRMVSITLSAMLSADTEKAVNEFTYHCMYAFYACGLESTPDKLLALMEELDFTNEKGQEGETYINSAERNGCLITSIAAPGIGLLMVVVSPPKA